MNWEVLGDRCATGNNCIERITGKAPQAFVPINTIKPAPATLTAKGEASQMRRGCRSASVLGL